MWAARTPTRPRPGPCPVVGQVPQRAGRAVARLGHPVVHERQARVLGDAEPGARTPRRRRSPAAGTAVRLSAASPAAATSTPGASSTRGPAPVAVPAGQPAAADGRGAAGPAGPARRRRVAVLAIARGRKVTTIPTAIAVAENVTAGRFRAGVRSAARIPVDRPAARSAAAGHGTEASPASAARPPASEHGPVADVRGQPDRQRQAGHRRHAAHHADQGQALAAPLRRA